jgi:hypothetical protein
MLYGVKRENIHLTGYPLPEENIGIRDSILKEDLRMRLVNLDPKKAYFRKYKALINDKLKELPSKSDHPLTILYSVGGAGAQADTGLKIVYSLKEKLEKGEVKIILSAGIRESVKSFFEKNIQGIKMLK